MPNTNLNFNHLSDFNSAFLVGSCTTFVLLSFHSIKSYYLYDFRSLFSVFTLPFITLISLYSFFWPSPYFYCFAFFCSFLPRLNAFSSSSSFCNLFRLALLGSLECFIRVEIFFLDGRKKRKKREKEAIGMETLQSSPNGRCSVRKSFRSP